jgi:hypothetical protein
MEKTEIENEAQDLKATEARSTCEECEEHDHVRGKPQFNASSSIQDLVPICTQLKDFMDEQAKINEDVITKCDAPGFRPSSFNPNDPVNRVDFGQMTVNLGHHLENFTNNP